MRQPVNGRNNSPHKPLKIAVLYRTTDGPWGGGNSFLRALKRTWAAQGVEVLDRLDANADGVLINSSYLGAVGRSRFLTPETARRMVEQGYIHPLPAAFGLSRWQKDRPPFVHRLDGVFKKYGRGPQDTQDRAQAAINRFMDWTVYQSAYCRDDFAGEGLDVSRSAVIWNGVDTACFYPADEPPSGSFKLVAVAWSTNARKGAPSVVEASRIPGVEVTYIGRWPEGLDPESARILPPMTHEALSACLREHHVLLNMAQNESCSNVILEGLCSGLPVIYHPSGSSAEIVAGCGASGEPDLRAAVEEVRDRFADLRAAAIARRPDLSIEEAARRYAEVFQSLGRIAR